MGDKMNEHSKHIFVWFFIFATICFIASLIFINSNEYDSKIKNVTRYHYNISLPDKRSINYTIDQREE